MLIWLACACVGVQRYFGGNSNLVVTKLKNACSMFTYVRYFEEVQLTSHWLSKAGVTCTLGVPGDTS